MTLPTFTNLAAAVWPDATTIDPSDIRTWGLEVETALNALFSRTPIINGAFVPTVDSNALTVALKTLAGADPSPADPVYVDFRHVTQGNGQSAVLAITAAVAMTVSGGATVGFSDGISGRLWAVLFNDGGTPRIGLKNCYAGGGVIYPLYPSLVTTSTDEGGDGSADTAGVMYTDGAVTDKAFVVLGHMTWETALATAGLWSAAPDVVHQQRWGDLLPGDLVQQHEATAIAVDTTTTTTPVDDTIPQLTEGKTFLSRDMTFVSAANAVEVDADLAFALSAAGTIVVALHYDSVADAIHARHADVGATNDSITIQLIYRAPVGDFVGSTTFKANGGPSTGTLTFNGINAARTLGGVNRSRLVVRERMA
jgi:hypothetical protein